MNEELDSQLSAMFDDELAPEQCELLARRLSRDEQLKSRWGRYAVIGAAIRSERGVSLNPPLAGRVSAVILTEPALSGSAAAQGVRRAALRWWQPVPGAAMATGVAPAEEQAPTHWLERMNQALTTRNYDGTFSHWHGGHVEMLRIIHRVQDGTVSERLASLDGSGREFVRTGASLSCYLPDKRTVVVERRPPEKSLVEFPAGTDQTASFYDIREVGRTRLTRRATHIITVSPN